MTMKEVAINAKRPRSQFVAVAQKMRVPGWQRAISVANAAAVAGCCVRG
jgi:hypothetical protein